MSAFCIEGQPTRRYGGSSDEADRVVTAARVGDRLARCVLWNRDGPGGIHTDLEVRYRLDEGMGSTANDSSTNNRNGTLDGASFIADGRIGGAATFDGTDDFIDCPAIAATDGANKLTIAFWLNTTSRTASEVVLSKFDSVFNNFSVQFGTTGTGDEDDLVVAIATSSTVGFVFTTGNVLSDATWIHVAVVYDGSLSGNTDKCKIYINGNLAATDSAVTVPATLLDSDTDHWYIGWRDNEPAEQSLDGKVDEFHLYTRALTASDIQELYIQSEGSILFNGNLESPNSKLENTTADVLAGSNQVTICAWVLADGQGESSAGVVTALDETGNGLVLRHNNTASTLRFIAQWDVTDGVWTFPATDGVWNAVAITYDNSDVMNAPKARVNFVDVTVTPVDAPDGMSAIAPGPGYCVGNLSGQGNTWAGRIAHLQFFNRILSAAEMDACSKDPGSVKHDLRLWLPTPTAEDIADQSGNDFDGTGTALETGSDAPPYDTRFLFAVTNEVHRQLIIPSNGTEPAIGIRGIGERSKLVASPLLKGGTRFITTENWTMFASTVIEPTVKELYLDGDQNVPTHPFGDPDPTESEIAVCHAVDIDGDAANVTDCKVFDFKGTAITVRNTTEELSPKIRIPRVRNNKISHCWSGILSAAVDTQIDGNRIASVRNYGIRELSGSVQCSNNHVFGAYTAIQFEGGPSRSLGDRFSDAAYGFRILSNASGSHIADGTTEHCTLKNILVEAERVRIHNTRILVANTSEQHPGEDNSGIESIVGLHLTPNATLSLISDCDIEVGAYTFEQSPGVPDTDLTGSTGVFVEAHNVIIDNLKIMGHPDISGEIGVRVGADRDGGDFFIDARGGGFRTSTGDRVVKFDANDCTGMVWYIVHNSLDTPVEIPAGWGSSLKIFTRAGNAADWVQLNTGQAYP